MKGTIVAACILGALFGGWPSGDKTLFGACIGVSYLDYRQTQKLKSLNMYELNPALGKHPSKGEINNYFLLSTTAKYLIADQVGDTWRSKFLWLLLLAEVAVVSHNVHVGIKW